MFRCQLSPFFFDLDSVRVGERFGKCKGNFNVSRFFEAVLVTVSNPEGMTKGDMKDLVRENRQTFFLRQRRIGVTGDEDATVVRTRQANLRIADDDKLR